MKAVLPWLVRALAIVGLCGLSLVGVFFVLSRGWPVIPDESHFGPPIVSPAGTHKAIVISHEGDGWLSRYCYRSVVVLAADVSPEQDRSGDAVVFEGPCDNFSPSGARVEASPRVEWMSSDGLLISFSIQTTVMRASTVKLRKQDESGSIRVRFEVRD
ncbi:hypothetical protein HNR00_004239 [Methylorubrum rhodinum]|uniref:Uncharacterized protein n=1 Tax=Methylorubrum rhodinum TaxID=29428 RepID=A0A840ZR40_9HYPH|nr:hypothetical protein [Methylorubrum rhodinum]MBB5759505.1 hypothetical protein [Methylorubrum rhodinum]